MEIHGLERGWRPSLQATLRGANEGEYSKNNQKQTEPLVTLKVTIKQWLNGVKRGFPVY
jgi:hypothetical protein